TGRRARLRTLPAREAIGVTRAMYPSRMADTILVTGATGRVASAVIPILQAQGKAVRVFLRNPAKAPQGVEVATGDFADGDSMEKALRCVSAAFLVTPMHQKAAEWASAFIAAARLAGRPRVVRLSAIKASPDGPT